MKMKNQGYRLSEGSLGLVIQSDRMQSQIHNEN